MKPPRGGFVISTTELAQLTNWTRHYIRDEELAKVQLPDVVPTKKKAARKTAHWLGMWERNLLRDDFRDGCRKGYRAINCAPTSCFQERMGQG
jgi:hypothetical protein